MIENYAELNGKISSRIRKELETKIALFISSLKLSRKAGENWSGGQNLKKWVGRQILKSISNQISQGIFGESLTINSWTLNLAKS